MDKPSFDPIATDLDRYANGTEPDALVTALKIAGHALIIAHTLATPEGQSVIDRAKYAIFNLLLDRFATMQDERAKP